MAMRTFLLTILTGALLAGCSEKATAPPEPELFVGELQVKRIDEVFERTDQVVLAVDGSSYELIHQTNGSQLCDSRGVVGNFGSNRITLTPETLDDNLNCDHQRIPRGEFQAAFSGGSLTLGPSTLVFRIVNEDKVFKETWQYTFTLEQR